MKKLIVSIISLFSLTVSAQPGRHIAAYTQFEQCKGVERVWHTPPLNGAAYGSPVALSSHL